MKGVLLPCFNSTLVRLEDINPGANGEAFTVSIPLWFDWKLAPRRHFGKTPCFNSTLVRLEDTLAEN